MCNRCGTYVITGSAIEQFHVQHNNNLPANDRVNVSSWLRTSWERARVANPDNPKFPGVTLPNFPFQDCVPFDEILRLAPRSVAEQLDRLLTVLGAMYGELGTRICFDATDYPLSWTSNSRSLIFLLMQMQSSGLIELELNTPEDIDPLSALDERFSHVPNSAMITLRGWNRIVELQNVPAAVLPYQAFVAMSFAPDMLATYDSSFGPAIRAAGFTDVRIDRAIHNNRIDDQIMTEIRRSRFLIADFTGHRGGVYFEAGYALGLRKPVIWTCRKDDFENTHFDTRSYPHMIWESAEDLADKLRWRIGAQIGPGQS